MGNKKFPSFVWLRHCCLRRFHGCFHRRFSLCLYSQSRCSCCLVVRFEIGSHFPQISFSAHFDFYETSVCSERFTLHPPPPIRDFLEALGAFSRFPKHLPHRWLLSSIKMPFKAIVRELRELRDGIGNISRRRSEGRHMHRQGRSHIAPERCCSYSTLVENQSRWANMPPELLLDIIHRVEESSVTWPARRDVVACASVCRSWRELAKEVVKTPEQCGLFTFPISLKQPGPRNNHVQCFIRRERASSTYRLYLGLSPALSGDMSKLLLAARKVRRATSTEFVISFVGDDYSKVSDTFVGKLRSNFLGTKFSISDNQLTFDPAIQSNCTLHPRIRSKQICPRVPAGNCNVATVMYELNVLRTRGPRRMQCILNSIPISSTEEGDSAPTPADCRKFLDERLCAVPVSDGKASPELSSTSSLSEARESLQGTRDSLILKNKSPRWHEQLQCWCLNFKGRVTVASVKNFQLVAAAEPHQSIPAAEQDQVILQFGKIGKDIFTMDYRYPLSAFQAFAICLSSFDTKPACE